MLQAEDCNIPARSLANNPRRRSAPLRSKAVQSSRPRAYPIVHSQAPASKHPFPKRPLKSSGPKLLATREQDDSDSSEHLPVLRLLEDVECGPFCDEEEPVFSRSPC